MRTKIVCTMGPSVLKDGILEEIFDQGMNVARLNFSHGTHQEHLKTILRIKEVRSKKNKPLAIMLDTKGPEIRVYGLSSHPLEVKASSRIELVKDPKDAKKEYIQIHPEIILDHIKIGMNILIDDGYVQAKVVDKDSKKATLEILNPGKIKLKKSINIPELEFHLPILSDEDILDLKFGAANDIDLIALSFVSSAEQILKVRNLLKELQKPNILLISKIESAMGVKNFDSILAVSDGIMIARGDLGVELPIEKIPKLQKEFISKCLEVGKPVIVATQMLESMIQNPRPTRAEASDVAGAIFDAASAIMLSGETAVGAYPLETVGIMSRIGSETEQAVDYEDYFFKKANRQYLNVSEAIACATVHSTYMTQSKMIVVCTYSGETARQISKFRPRVKIIAITPDEKTFHQLSLTWGVVPILKDVKTMQEAIKIASEYSIEQGICRIGDLFVVTSGAMFGVTGSTNMLIFESIGKVLVRGLPSKVTKVVSGAVFKISFSDRISKKEIKDKIVIIRSFIKEDIELLKAARGIILQNILEDLETLETVHIIEDFGIPIITQADGAMEIISDVEIVTLDPKKGVVFKGNIAKNSDPNIE